MGSVWKSKHDASGALPGTAPGSVRFLVVRHGETLFNVMGKVQGWCDTPLTEKGIAEAEALGRGLTGIEFVGTFSSDSGRAIQTLDRIMMARQVDSRNGASGKKQEVLLPRVADQRLREWCYGEFEGEPGERLHVALDAGFGEALSFEEHNRRLPEVADAIADADRSGRAERFDSIERRLRAFFVEAGEGALENGGGSVLVVTHSFVIRTLIYLLDRARVNEPVKIPNASVTDIVYDGVSFVPGDIGSTAFLSR